MALQGTRNPITLPVTGGASGAVAANLIVVADGANPGNVKLSVAAALGFVGVTTEGTTAAGYAPVQTRDIVQIRVGASNITAGNLIASDANAMAVPITPAGTGSPKQVVGVALTSALAGNLVDVLIAHQIALV